MLVISLVRSCFNHLMWSDWSHVVTWQRIPPITDDWDSSWILMSLRVHIAQSRRSVTWSDCKDPERLPPRHNTVVPLYNAVFGMKNFTYKKPRCTGGPRYTGNPINYDLTWKSRLHEGKFWEEDAARDRGTGTLGKSPIEPMARLNCAQFKLNWISITYRHF